MPAWAGIALPVGRRNLVLDEPTDQPEGTEVELTVVEDDDFTPEERARLDAALERSSAQASSAREQLVDDGVAVDKLTGVCSGPCRR